MVDLIKPISDLCAGQCVSNYNNMTSAKKKDTIAKTTGAALTAGLITAAVSVPMAPVAFACVAAYAFAYMTSSYDMNQYLEDHAKEGVKSAVNFFKK